MDASLKDPVGIQTFPEIIEEGYVYMEKEELFKGQYILSVMLIVFSMVFINIIFRDSVLYVVKSIVGIAQILINTYLLVRSIQIKEKELIRIFAIAFILDVAVTFGGLYFVYN